MPTFVISYKNLLKEITIDEVKSHIDNEVKELDEKRQELLDRINHLKNTRGIDLTFEEIKLQLAKASQEREECKKRKSELTRFRDGKITIPSLFISGVTYSYDGGVNIYNILPDDYSPDISFEQKIFNFEPYKVTDDNLTDHERLAKRLEFYNNQLAISHEIDRYNIDYPKYLKVKHFYENFFKMRDGETAEQFYLRAGQIGDSISGGLRSIFVLTETGKYNVQCSLHIPIKYTSEKFLRITVDNNELAELFKNLGAFEI